MPKKSSDTDRGSSDPTELERAIRACRSAFAVCAMFSLVINVVMLTLIATIALAVMCALDALRTSVTIRLGCWLNEQLGPAYLACAVRGRLKGDFSGAQPLRDITQIQSFIATQGLTAFFDAPWVPIFVVLIWILHPMLGFVALSSAVLIFVLSIVKRDGHTQGQPDSQPQADRGDAVGRCDDPQRRDRASHAHFASHDRSLGSSEWNG